MYVLLEGIVKTFYEDAAGRAYVKIFLSPFEIASPYLEIVNRVPSKCYITALVPTTALRFRYLDLELFFQRSEAWKSLHLKVIEHYYSIKEKREFEFLTLSAFERYQNFQRDYQHIADQIPQKDVAAFLGISPVSLSRLRRRKTLSTRVPS